MEVNNRIVSNVPIAKRNLHRNTVLLLEWRLGYHSVSNTLVAVPSCYIFALMKGALGLNKNFKGYRFVFAHSTRRRSR